MPRCVRARAWPHAASRPAVSHVTIPCPILRHAPLCHTLSLDPRARMQSWVGFLLDSEEPDCAAVGENVSAGSRIMKS